MRLPPWDDGTLAKLFHRLRQLRDILLAAEQTGRIDRPGPFGPDDECCCTDARGEVENTFAVGARHASPRADDKDPFAWQARHHRLVSIVINCVAPCSPGVTDTTSPANTTA